MITHSKPSDHITFRDYAGEDCAGDCIDVLSYGEFVGYIQLVWDDHPDIKDAFDGHYFHPEKSEIFTASELRKIMEYMESIPMLKDGE